VATSLCASEVLGFSSSSDSQYQRNNKLYGIYLNFHPFDVSPQGDVGSSFENTWFDNLYVKDSIKSQKKAPDNHLTLKIFCADSMLRRIPHQ
jgi:hypothetical protein